MPRKLIVYCLSLIGLLIFASPAFAQTKPSIKPIPTASEAAIPNTTYPIPATVSPTSPIYTDLMVYNLLHTTSCIMSGISIIRQPCLTYQITKNAQGAIQSIPILSSANLSGGLIGTTTGLVSGLLITSPIKTSDYLSSIGQDLGIIKEAHAQVFGSGAAVLKPIFTLWQVSRNIAYVFMIIIFLVIGLMVMFRQRINPQTVITAQAALPGLVIGLIMITFSYFLAALISDTAFVGTNLVGYFFTTAQNTAPYSLVEKMSGENVLSVFSKFVGVVGSGDITHALEIVFNAAGPDVENFFRFAAGLIAFNYTSQVGHLVPALGNLASIVTGLAGSVVTAAAAPQILGQVLAYVSMVVLIYSMLKLLLRLINCYLTIIFLTISAPFQFLIASLPGRQGNATDWMLNMLGNILVFPAIVAVLYFVAYLLAPLGNTKYDPPFKMSDAAMISQSGPVNTAFAAAPVPVVGEQTFPLFGGLDTSFITIILALGALIASPSIPDIIVRSVGKAGQAGQLLGQELSGNIAGGRGFSNQGQQVSQIGQTIGQKYTAFRGTSPDYSPSKAAGWDTKTVFGRHIFTRRKN